MAKFIIKGPLRLQSIKQKGLKDNSKLQKCLWLNLTGSSGRYRRFEASTFALVSFSTTITLSVVPKGQATSRGPQGLLRPVYQCDHLFFFYTSDGLTQIMHQQLKNTYENSTNPVCGPWKQPLSHHLILFNGFSDNLTKILYHQSAPFENRPIERTSLRISTWNAWHGVGRRRKK